MKKFNHYNSRGFTIVEAMIALGILFGASMATLNLYDMYLKNMKDQSLKMTKQQVLANLKNQLTESSLDSSARITDALNTGGLTGTQGNTHFEELAKCLPNIADKRGCAQKVTGGSIVEYPFLLHPLVPAGSESQDLIMAGEGVYYDKNGILCNPARFADAKACPVQTRMSFIPTCKDSASECNKAHSLRIFMDVSIRADYFKNGVGQTGVVRLEHIVNLQRGLELTSMLDEKKRPILANGLGIYETQVYRDTDAVGVNKDAMAQGLVLNGRISSAAGLSRIELHSREIHGSSLPSGNSLHVPPAINTAKWELVTTVEPVADLAQGLRNQTFSFDQLAGSDAFFPISGIYLFDGSKAETPSFEGGFYQFKATAFYDDGSTVDSSNFYNLRIYSLPQIVAPQSVFSFPRDCQGSSSTIPFKIFDDEGVGEVKVSVIQGPSSPLPNISAPSFSKGSKVISSNFKFPNDAAPTTDLGIPYIIEIQARSINSSLYSIHQIVIDIEDVTPILEISELPDRVKKEKSIEKMITARQSSCCSTSPKITMSYIDSGSLSTISGPKTASLSCSYNATENRNDCSGKITINGLELTPPGDSTPNFVATVESKGGTGCLAEGEQASQNIEVFSAPVISFYQPESLWVDIPSGVGISTPVVPTIYLMMSNPPSGAKVSVNVVKATNNEVVCSNVTFNPGVSTDPVFQACSPKVNYKGSLKIVAAGPNVGQEGDTDSKYDGLISGSKKNHNFCRVNFATILSPQITVGGNHSFLQSPFGPGDPDNDQDWNDGDVRNLTCFDNWGDGGRGMFEYHGKREPPNTQDNAFNVSPFGNASQYSDWRTGQWVGDFPTHYTFPVISATDSTRNFNPLNAPYLFGIVKQAKSSDNPWGNFGLEHDKGKASAKNTDFGVGNTCGFLKETVFVAQKFFGGSYTTHAVNQVNKAWGRVGGKSPQRLSKARLDYMFVCTYGDWKPRR